MSAPLCLTGQPWPLGATPLHMDGVAGVNLAVFSRHASAIEVCLYSADGQTETARLRLPACTDGVWHGFVPGLGVGQLYGLRAHGPYQPRAGHRFNPHKLLIDPYARAVVGDCTNLSELCGDRPEGSLDALNSQPDTSDDAALMPKARVIDSAAERAAGAAITPAPRIAAEQTVLYEAHVKALTRSHPDVPEALRGTYAGLASAPMLAHYRRLGITTLCLLPVQLHISELHLLRRGLTNHWGYNTLGFFIPEPDYAGAGKDDDQTHDDQTRAEFRAMVDTLHRHGLEVVLDVVYNHSAESDIFGPTLSWRGLDNACWYSIDGSGHYLNPTGCGNALNFGEPRVVQMVMDSLRWWVEAFGVDGFRFDLATTLARDPVRKHGELPDFNPHAPLLVAIAQDPLLGRVKCIAEPWDIGPGGYQAGRFPAGWREWNDRFRDTARAYWLGHPCTRGAFARRLTGSPDLFQHHGRAPLAGINLITAHDGFTLADLTAYNERHNLANGENNRDGHGHNLSANGGVEGPTDDARILETRRAWQRALLATLFCAQGTPQLLAGDEIGHSQAGNNNAYCQDNALTWLDWAAADQALIDYVARLIALRHAHPGLRHGHWFSGRAMPGGEPDITWRLPDGGALAPADWDDDGERAFACVIVVGEAQHRMLAAPRERLMLLFNPGADECRFILPPDAWSVLLDSAALSAQDLQSGKEPDQWTNACSIAARALVILLQPLPDAAALT